jgi:hypothetical protein
LLWEKESQLYKLGGGFGDASVSKVALDRFEGGISVNIREHSEIGNTNATYVT